MILSCVYATFSWPLAAFPAVKRLLVMPAALTSVLDAGVAFAVRLCGVCMGVMVAVDDGLGKSVATALRAVKHSAQSCFVA